MPSTTSQAKRRRSSTSVSTSDQTITVVTLPNKKSRVEIKSNVSSMMAELEERIKQECMAGIEARMEHIRREYEEQLDEEIAVITKKTRAETKALKAELEEVKRKHRLEIGKLRDELSEAKEELETAVAAAGDQMADDLATTADEQSTAISITEKALKADFEKRLADIRYEIELQGANKIARSTRDIREDIEERIREEIQSAQILWEKQFKDKMEPDLIGRIKSTLDPPQVTSTLTIDVQDKTKSRSLLVKVKESTTAEQIKNACCKQWKESGDYFDFTFRGRPFEGERTVEKAGLKERDRLEVEYA